MTRKEAYRQHKLEMGQIVFESIDVEGDSFAQVCKDMGAKDDYNTQRKVEAFYMLYQQGFVEEACLVLNKEIEDCLAGVGIDENMDDFEGLED